MYGISTRIGEKYTENNMQSYNRSERKIVRFFVVVQAIEIRNVRALNVYGTESFVFKGLLEMTS